MADRTNAADTRHQCRHLLKRPAVAERFEASNLGHMKVRIPHFAVLTQLDGDLGMSFDASYGIDPQGRHRVTPSLQIGLSWRSQEHGPQTVPQVRGRWCQRKAGSRERTRPPAPPR